MKRKKVILYCRVACSDQADKELYAQEQSLREYVEKQDYEVAQVVTEICSGSNLNRSGINKIYEIIDRQKIDAVISKNISRYGRCSLVDFIETLAEKGVKTVTITDGNLRNIIPVLKSMA